MTDERLDQILKQALSPEVSEADVQIREERKEKHMGKIARRGVAFAACAACAAFVALGGAAGIYRDGAGRPSPAEQESAAKTADPGGPFVLTACAAELEKDSYVPIVIGGEHSWALSGDEKSKTVSYVIGTDFHCEGENIDSITYSINNGAFDFSEMADDSIVVSETAYDGPDLGIRSGSVGNVENADGEILSTSRMLKEYTVKYDTQENSTTFIGICGKSAAEGMFDAIFPQSGDSDPETEAAAFSKLLDGVEITCTAHFTNGTSASQVIAVSGKVLTLAEAGLCEEGETLADGKSWETKQASFVFGLK